VTSRFEAIRLCTAKSWATSVEHEAHRANRATASTVISCDQGPFVTRRRARPEVRIECRRGGSGSPLTLTAGVDRRRRPRRARAPHRQHHHEPEHHRDDAHRHQRTMIYAATNFEWVPMNRIASSVGNRLVPSPPARVRRPRSATPPRRMTTRRSPSRPRKIWLRATRSFSKLRVANASDKW